MVDHNGLEYLACEPTLFDIDKDISMEMIKIGHGVGYDQYFISIYNDRKDSSVSFSTTSKCLKGLADFLIKHL